MDRLRDGVELEVEQTADGQYVLRGKDGYGSLADFECLNPGHAVALILLRCAEPQDILVNGRRARSWLSIARTLSIQYPDLYLQTVEYLHSYFRDAVTGVTYEASRLMWLRKVFIL